MIKATELRIGNHIRYNPNGGFGDVIELHTIGKHTAYGRNLDNQLINLKIDLDRWIDPIPLTPEILEGCGFEGDIIDNFRLQVGADYTQGCLIFYISPKRNNIQISYGLGGDKSSYIYLPIPKSLHQLQNLYFALTGQELNINLHVETAN
ncbi:MAG TPA: hypothetical protein VFF27_04075 [Bacteroidia bacterium]|jgi:hypothetical protein|nr:hypothetical protein [Bacteroidia bacterium]